MESTHGMYTRKGLMHCRPEMKYEPVASFANSMAAGSYIGLKQKSPNHAITLYEIPASKAKQAKTSLLPGAKQKFETRVANANTYIADRIRRADVGEVPDIVQVFKPTADDHDAWGDKRDRSSVDVFNRKLTEVKGTLVASPSSPFVIGTGGATDTIQKAGGKPLNDKLRLAAAHFEHLMKRPFAVGDVMAIKIDRGTSELSYDGVIVAAVPDARGDRNGPSRASKDALQRLYRTMFDAVNQMDCRDIVIPAMGAKTFGYGASAGEIAANESALAAERYKPLHVTLLAREPEVLQAMNDTLLR